MKKLRVGDKVRFLRASNELLVGLLPSDQEAIQAAVGEVILVESFDDYGHVELEWVEDRQEKSFHTRSIWVDPNDVARVSEDTPLTLLPLSGSD